RHRAGGTGPRPGPVHPGGVRGRGRGTAVAAVPQSGCSRPNLGPGQGRAHAGVPAAVGGPIPRGQRGRFLRMERGPAPTYQRQGRGATRSLGDFLLRNRRRRTTGTTGPNGRTPTGGRLRARLPFPSPPTPFPRGTRGEVDSSLAALGSRGAAGELPLGPGLR